MRRNTTKPFKYTELVTIRVTKTQKEFLDTCLNQSEAIRVALDYWIHREKRFRKVEK